MYIVHHTYMCTYVKNTRYLIPDIQSRISDPEYLISDIQSRISDPGYSISDIWSRISDPGYHVRFVIRLHQWYTVK